MKLFNSVEASLPQTLMKTQKQKIGLIGENIAVKHLVKHNYKIIERNYSRKWGEIDIVAQKNKILHFVEVKSKSVSYETSAGHMPEENVHPWKMKRLSRIIRTYLADKRIPEDQEFQIDIVAVFVDLINKKAKLRMTDNVILS